MYKIIAENECRVKRKKSNTLSEKLNRYCFPEYRRIYSKENGKLVKVERNFELEFKNDEKLLKLLKGYLIEHHAQRYYREMKENRRLFQTWDMEDFVQETYLAFLIFLKKFRDKRWVYPKMTRDNNVLWYKCSAWYRETKVGYFLSVMDYSIRDHFRKLLNREKKKAGRTTMDFSKLKKKEAEGCFFENKCVNRLFLNIYRKKLGHNIENESIRNNVLSTYDMLRKGYSLREISLKLNISYRYLNKLYNEYIKNSGKRVIRRKN